MRLALDARCLQHPLHGMARYTLNLLRHLPLSAHDSLLVIHNRQDFAPLADLLPVQQARQMIWIDAQTPLFSPNESWRMGRLLRQLQPELLHIPTYWKPYASPCPWLLTVHDLIHLLPPVALRYQVYYHWLRRQLRQAAGLLTVSQASALALQAWAGAACPPLHVTPLGSEPQYQPAPAAASDSPYALFVGHDRPHKGFALALAATAALQIPLYSVGVPASGLSHHQALHHVPEAELPALYQGARLLLLPSQLEGFGLPGLEALACGTPVLASDLPVLREVLGPAAEYVAAPKRGSWTDALQVAWQAARKHDPKWQKLAQQQVAGFSWQRTAAQTYAAYSRCA